MTNIPGALEELDEATCWSLLGEVLVGRVGVATPDGTILVLPVNFVVEGRTIVFRTGPGAALDHLGGSATFQADAVDAWHHSGWSVLAHGSVVVADAPAGSDDLPHTWVASKRGAVVRIRVERITGRVVRPAAIEWDVRGYL